MPTRPWLRLRPRLRLRVRLRVRIGLGLGLGLGLGSRLGLGALLLQLATQLGHARGQRGLRRHRRAQVRRGDVWQRDTVARGQRGAVLGRDPRRRAGVRIAAPGSGFSFGLEFGLGLALGLGLG